MTAFREQLRQVFVVNKFFLLLAALVVTLVCAPVLDDGGLVGRMMHLTCLTLVILAAVAASLARRGMFWAGVFIAAVALPVLWSDAAFQSEPLTIGRLIVSALFFVAMASMILVAVFRDDHTPVQAIFGAICSYLLIGLAWAMIYAAIEHVDDNPFAVAHRRTVGTEGSEFTAFSQLIYFSFVTMSTLGYGDISPRSPFAESATWMQSVTGQFYLAVLVARLIAVLPVARREA